MKKPQMNENEKTKIIKEYSVKCALCNKNIIGTSVNMVDYNYRLHYESHFKKKVFR